MRRRNRNRTTTPPAKLYWQQTRQEKWWCSGSAYGSNNEFGSPIEARIKHDKAIRLDPNAPMRIRPLWAITRYGKNGKRIRPELIEEIRERTQAGYRVSYCNREGTPEDLVRDLEAMSIANALPWGIGLGNEPEFGRKITPQQFGTLLAGIAPTLWKLSNRYDVKISPPALSSFINLADGYGAEIRKKFGGRNDVYIRVHNYRYTEPINLIKHDARQQAFNICGLPSHTIIFIEEMGWGFAKHGATEPVDNVINEVGADFHLKSLRAANQTGMPAGQFMNYDVGDFNSISHEVFGRMRYEAGLEHFEEMRETGDVGTIEDLELINPSGKTRPR